MDAVVAVVGDLDLGIVEGGRLVEDSPAEVGALVVEDSGQGVGVRLCRLGRRHLVLEKGEGDDLVLDQVQEGPRDSGLDFHSVIDRPGGSDSRDIAEVVVAVERGFVGVVEVVFVAAGEEDPRHLPLTAHCLVVEGPLVVVGARQVRHRGEERLHWVLDQGKAEDPQQRHLAIPISRQL